MKKQPVLSLAASVNAVGANATLSNIVTAVQNYPPCKHLDYRGVTRVVDAFNDQQLLQMAQLVLANAQVEHQKALRRAAVKAGLSPRNKMAGARKTAEEVKGSLLTHAEGFMERGERKAPDYVARRIRHLAQLWGNN